TLDDLGLRLGGQRLPIFGHDQTRAKKFAENRVMGRLRGLGVPASGTGRGGEIRSEEHTSELQSLTNLVCRLLLQKKKNKNTQYWRMSECVTVRQTAERSPSS